jgi:hypothetical protein
MQANSRIDEQDELKESDAGPIELEAKDIIANSTTLKS